VTTQGNRWFIGIGINSYAEFEPLINAVKDVEDILSELVQRYGFSYDRARLLLNASATQSNIINLLEALVEEASEDDSVLIYFSGHGHYNKRTEIGYWVPSDGKQGSSASYVANSTIRDYLRAIGSKHTLLISDSCFSGALFQRGSGRRIEAASQLDKIPSRWAICSGRHDEQVLDGVPGENSPFAESILDVLRSNEEPLLRVASLAIRVVDQTRANYEQLPEGSPLQGVGHKGGEFIFHLTDDALNEEELLWRDSLAQPTSESLSGYLDRFPSGKNAQYARALLHRLKEQEAWELAVDSDAIEFLREYTTRYPDGRFIAEAEARILKAQQNATAASVTALRETEFPTSKTQTGLLVFLGFLLGIYGWAEVGLAYYWFESGLFLPALATWAAIRPGVSTQKVIICLTVFALFSVAVSLDTVTLGFDLVGFYLVLGIFGMAVVNGADWKPLHVRFRDTTWKAVGLTGLVVIAVVDGLNFSFLDDVAIVNLDLGLMLAVILILAANILLHNRNTLSVSSTLSTIGFGRVGGSVLTISVFVASLFLLSYSASDSLEVRLGMWTRESALWLAAFFLTSLRLLDWRLVLGVFSVAFLLDNFSGTLLESIEVMASESADAAELESVQVYGSRISDVTSRYVHTVAAVLFGVAIAPFVETRNPASLSSFKTILLVVSIVVLQSLPDSFLPQFTVLGAFGAAFLSGLAWSGFRSMMASGFIISMYAASSHFQGGIYQDAMYDLAFVALQVVVMWLLGMALRKYSLALREFA